MRHGHRLPRREEGLGNRGTLKSLNVDMAAFVDSHESLSAQAGSEWKAMRRRRNNVHPQPEEVLASWVAPYTEIFPGQTEPTRSNRLWKGCSPSDYTAYELPMDWREQEDELDRRRLHTHGQAPRA